MTGGGGLLCDGGEPRAGLGEGVVRRPRITILDPVGDGQASADIGDPIVGAAERDQEDEVEILVLEEARVCGRHPHSPPVRAL
jgi:hypothetical protein